MTDSLVVAGRNVSLWGAQTHRRLADLNKAVYPFVLHPDGKRLITASSDDWRKMLIWDLTNPHVPSATELKDREPYPSTRHENSLGVDGMPDRTYPSIKKLAVSRDGAFLAIGRGTGVIRLWDLPRGKALATIRGHDLVISGLNFSPDGAWLASCSLNDGRILHLA